MIYQEASWEVCLGDNYILARTFQEIIGNPTEYKFKQIVSWKLLTNCPVRLDNITNVDSIFGPQQSLIQGKAVRKIQSGWRQNISLS